MGTILQAARGGTRKELLTAMRDNIATRLDDNPPAHTMSALVGRLSDIDTELRALDSAEGGDELGDAAKTPDAEFDAEAL